jgi:TetR/AcrR family transcriptional regulator, repressor for neighboring sulfatase
MQSMTTDVKRPSGRDEVVEALLDAADRLFTISGPADVSLRAIAREADVNHGMVHRHFGTRDDLVDRLLERMAAKWTARTQAEGDFTSAIDSILGPADDAETSAGSWIRLLAWSLLTESGDRPGESQRRYATLDMLPGMLDGDSPEDAAEVTAAVLALVFGWRFFHPYIRAALHLEEADFATLHQSMVTMVHKITTP